MLTERVRQAEADFLAPEGVDEAEAARLRKHAGKLAMFDPSHEATLARKYEAAAERSFFRALKELRQVEKAAKAAVEQSVDAMYRETVGSFSQMEKLDDEFDALYPEEAPPTPRNRFGEDMKGDPMASRGRADVPIMITRPR